MAIVGCWHVSAIARLLCSRHPCPVSCDLIAPPAVSADVRKRCAVVSAECAASALRLQGTRSLRRVGGVLARGSSSRGPRAPSSVVSSTFKHFNGFHGHSQQQRATAGHASRTAQGTAAPPRRAGAGGRVVAGAAAPPLRGVTACADLPGRTSQLLLPRDITDRAMTCRHEV